VLTVNSGGTAILAASKLSKNTGNFTSSGTNLVNNAGGTLIISDSEISEGNGSSGGGLVNHGTASIEYSTFFKNSGERSGAIGNDGTLYMHGSTIGRNESQLYAAAISNSGTAYITSSTIAYNRTDLDPQVSCSSSSQLCSAIQNWSPGYMEISGSVIAHNTARSNQTRPNCIGTPSSMGGNLLGETGSTACSVATLPGALPNIPWQDPGLHNSAGEPLWYGGVGRTYMPTLTSPLLDQLPASSNPCQSPDQRGVRRWARPCDIGAVERAPALLVVGNLTLSSGDSVLKFLLENMGYTVTVELSTSTSSASANGKALVVISESVTSGDVNTKFRDVFTGVMVLESALFDDMRMTGTTNNTHYGVTNDNAIILKPGAIASKFGALGTLATTTSTVSYSWGVPDVNASRDATLGTSNSRWGLFAYYPGGVMVPNTQFAPGYRVGAFATNAAMGTLSADGAALLQEAMLFVSR
jgi:hypothetical protein